MRTSLHRPSDTPGTDGRWQIAHRVAPDRVVSTVDPQARHAHKTRSRRQDGFKAHLVVEPDTGLITDTALAPASGAAYSDAAVGIDLLTQAEHQHAPAHPGDDDPQDRTSPDRTSPDPQDQRGGDQQTARFEVLADAAYGTGEALAALEAAGHTAVIKPWPLRPAVPGGFTLDDFVVTEPTDTHAGSVTCPNGVVRPITAKRTVTFGAACRDCPLRARCTTSQSGRSLTLHPQQARQRAHRERATDPDFQAVYRAHRPMGERSIAWLVGDRNRRLRFRGTALNDLWLHHRVAGLNLRRLLNLGLTRTDGVWALA